MSLSNDHQILINTPVGNIAIDGDSISKLVKNIKQDLDTTRNIDVMDIEIAQFIGIETHALEHKMEDITENEFPVLAEGMMRYINEHFDIIEITNQNHSPTGGKVTSPVYHDFTLKGNRYKVPLKAVIMLEHKDSKERMAIWLIPYDGLNTDIRVIFDGDGVIGKDFWNDFNDWYWAGNTLLKNSTFYGNLKFIETDQKNNWDDIILTEEHRYSLQRNIIDFFQHMEMFRSLGQKLSRGVLLNGPPGTGKTLTANILRNCIEDITTIVVTRDHIEELGDISRVYSVAAKLSPSLVILEDLDTIGGISRMSGDHPLLGEFLNALSGIESNVGVVTLATTNHADKLDWALVDRPGRFDSRIELGYPNATVRKRILLKYLEPLNYDKDMDMTYIVRKSEQMSGAYLEEIIRNSFQNALETVNYDLKKYKITLQDIELSLERILKQRKTTLDEFARNDLALPNYEDEEDEFDTFGEFYG